MKLLKSHFFMCMLSFKFHFFVAWCCLLIDLNRTRLILILITANTPFDLWFSSTNGYLRPCSPCFWQCGWRVFCLFSVLPILQAFLALLGFTQGGSRGTGVTYFIGLPGWVGRSLGRRAMAGVWLRFGFLFNLLCLLDSDFCYGNTKVSAWEPAR